MPFSAQVNESLDIVANVLHTAGRGACLEIQSRELLGIAVLELQKLRDMIQQSAVWVAADPGMSLTSPPRKPFTPSGQQLIATSRELRSSARQCRRRAIEAELSLALTMCRNAETLIRLEQRDQANRTLELLRVSMRSLRRRVEDPHHVPREWADDIQLRLKELEDRTMALDIGGTA